jgi:DNA-binding CsgD family transcriptional regulator
MKEIPTYTPDFEEYIRQGEPDKKERAQIWRTASPIYLERFFRNLLLGENNPLLNREMHLDWKGVPPSNDIQSAIQSANSTENPLSKCKNCTLEEAAVLLLVQKNPSITQKQIAVQIGKSERTVKTITVNLVEKGIIVRRNGKRNGYWEIIKE